MQTKAGGPQTATVYSVPPGCSFLTELVNSLMEGRLIAGFTPKHDPLQLPLATIFVPNRRTARALAVAFLDADGSKARLLPKIKTLGDTEDEFGLKQNLDDLQHDLRVVGTLERQLELAKLIRKWVEALSGETRRLYGDEEIFIPSSQADAVRLSRDLCGLLDQITQQETSWDAIGKVIPEEHAQWWSITSTFLQIIMKHWPAMLAEQQLIDPAHKARLMIDRRIKHIESGSAAGPMIIAGTTGSVPSTRRLLRTVSCLRDGAIILPGLDKSMPDQEWKMLSANPLTSEDVLESHPQYGLANLLSDMGVDRDEVIELGTPPQFLNDRNRILSTVLSLPECCGSWKSNRAAVADDALIEALENVALIEAITERQEALAIAIALRETLETPNKTAALVTPDRNLARRVGVELVRFGVNVDDSAGQPLANTPVGMFVRQVVRICFDIAGKTDLAGLLKSALFRAGQSKNNARELGEAIELLALRGSVGAPSSGYLHRFVERGLHQWQARKGEQDDAIPVEWQSALEHARTIDRLFHASNQQLRGEEAIPLSTYILALREFLTNLTMDETENSSLDGVSGTGEINALFDEMIGSAAGEFEIKRNDFPSVFEALLDGKVARVNQITHPRLHIYGPLEIRLLDHDRVFMAGLNEGSWPQATRNDAFLNRTMRQQLGMASPEQRTGLAAHDFQQIMGKREVVLSRSTRVDKAPTIASRWVQRLAAFVGEDAMGAVRNRGMRFLDLTAALDESDGTVSRRPRPNPRPPVDVRPRRLPVTDIETWIRDPYALYAKRILKLRPLDTLERDADQLLRGILYHAIVEEYVDMDRLKVPFTAKLETIRQIASRLIAEQQLEPDVELVWKFRFDEIARQFVDWENEYSAEKSIHRIHKELAGNTLLADGTFTLFARADRIDELTDGSLVVLDYKTGSSPSPKQARTLSPQLALEGVIAQNGGFEKVEPGKVGDLAFVRLIQGHGFGYQRIADRHTSVDYLIANTRRSLEELVISYRDPETGYVSRRAPFREGDISGDYDHLARTREWSFGEEEELG